MGISRKEALDCFASDDLIGIGMEADALRRSLHPEGVVSYTIDGRARYTEAATGAGFDRLCEDISSIVAMGGTGVMLQGEVTPALTISWFDGLFRRIKQRFPAIWLHSLSASEILAVAEQSEATVQDPIVRLRDAGLDSIPGDDAGILDDAVQHQGARVKWTTADWIAVHRAAHKLGIQTTATMMFGGGETMDHRVNHLETGRQLHEETGGFTSFTPWSLAPQAAAVQGF